MGAARVARRAEELREEPIQADAQRLSDPPDLYGVYQAWCQSQPKPTKENGRRGGGAVPIMHASGVSRELTLGHLYLALCNVHARNAGSLRLCALMRSVLATAVVVVVDGTEMVARSRTKFALVAWEEARRRVGGSNTAIVIASFAKFAMKARVPARLSRRTCIQIHRQRASESPEAGMALLSSPRGADTHLVKLRCSAVGNQPDCDRRGC